MEVTCGSLREKDIGKKVTLNGWCRYIREHGDKTFIDLADRYGITQVVFESKLKEDAGELGREYVITISGKVRSRGKENINHDNPTGAIEIEVKTLKIIGRSKVPPFEIVEEKESLLPAEDLRLKYRYLDLRRKKMIKNIEFRDAVTKAIRTFFWKEGFLELETPNLVRDSYDVSGSRTMIVPSRIKKGEFFALPQSPQIYKQLCMVAGLDKYFQVARVFRDEDPREDRQPEFTQVDFEVSFKDEKYIQELIERAVKYVFEKVLNKQIKTPFEHLNYDIAMQTYGNDKPDLRFGYKLVDITGEAKKSGYNVIKRIVESDGHVAAIAFQADFGKKTSLIDKEYLVSLVDTAKNLGLKGLTWLYVKDSKLKSIPESISEALLGIEKQLITKTGASDGDIIIIGADTSENVLLAAMSKLRRIVGLKIGKFKKEHAFLWVDNFPLFEKDEVNGKLQPAHNPFVAPTEDTIMYLDSAPEKVIGKRYDLVLNGIEIAGGSLRINDPDVQIKVLKSIGLSDADIASALGFLIEGLAHGAPIHGGAAIGLDRFVATLAGQDDIKDFILFPRNRKLESPLDASPSKIAPERLKNDYGLYIEK
jgi:aspartyl-tRNA synthetase